MQTRHPTTDPKLPSYVGPALRAVMADLQLVRHCWQLLRDPSAEDPDALKRTYLPKEPREPEAAYKIRLAYARYPTFFPDAIRAFSGILSRFQLANPPQSFDQAKENIDRCGNSFKALMTAADQGVCRDGGCYVLVDAPSDRPQNLAQQQAARRRPYLTVVDRADVLSVRVRMVGTVEVPEQVVIREWVEEQDPDGPYGTKLGVRYRVIRTQGGQTSWEVLRLDEAADGKLTPAVDVDANGAPRQGVYEAAGGKPFPRPPIIWYPSRIAEGFGRGAVPLSGLALDTIDHFRTRGDQKELMRKLAMPVPTRIGMPPPEPGRPEPSITLGANSFLDLPAGASFSFVSPSSDSLAPRATEVQHIEELIREQTLAFMYGQSGNKTATQAGMEGAQSQANIRTMVEAKVNVVQQIMELWCLFTGETLSADAGIVMDANLHDRPLESADVAQLSALASNELLSEQSIAEILIRGGVNTAVTSAAEELKRIADERKRRDQANAAPGPADPAAFNNSSLPVSDLTQNPDGQPQ